MPNARSTALPLRALGGRRCTFGGVRLRANPERVCAKVASLYSPVEVGSWTVWNSSPHHFIKGLLFVKPASIFPLGPRMFNTTRRDTAQPLLQSAGVFRRVVLSCSEVCIHHWRGCAGPFPLCSMSSLPLPVQGCTETLIPKGLLKKPPLFTL